MPHIRVVTDSTCDIPDPLLRQLDITAVPLHIQWGNRTFLDKVTFTAEDALSHLQLGDVVDSEAPSVEEFSRVYRSMRDTCDGVISLHLSSKLSETYSSALVAREGFSPIGQGGPFPVAVVDTMSVTM